MTRDQIAEINENAAWIPGFSAAIIGMTTGGEPRVVYSVEKIVRILVKRNGWTEEGAYEFFDYNIECEHWGNDAGDDLDQPIFVRERL